MRHSQPRCSSRTASTSRVRFSYYMLNNNRRGFAIPTAILVILVLTIMLAGGFSLVSAERRSVGDQKSQVAAFRLAEQGLELFLVRRDSLMATNPNYTKVPGAIPDTVQINMTGGYAQVTLTRLRPVRGTQSGLYVVRSRGVETATAYSGSPQAVRTVAQYVRSEERRVGKECRSRWSPYH